jgi:hypothetical protein
MDDSNLRWEPYFIRNGNDFYSFWEYFLSAKKRNILYVVGKGFDPRMCSGINAILDIGGDGRRDCLLIDYDEGRNSPSRKHLDLVKGNQSKLECKLKDRGELITKSIKMWSDSGPGMHRISSISAARLFSSINDMNGYTDILIDISAMPRSIYFSLIGKVLYILDNVTDSTVKRPNLHVIVSEAVEIDKQITDAGIDENAAYIHGFGGLETESTEGISKIWIPILGEGRQGLLERIHTFVNPDEICPILPFPSSNPRRGDDLFIEYRELLFDQWRIDPKNIIFASERNPFEAYRQIYKTTCHYNKALEPLQGTKTVVSDVSSKLLSIGALLATYELKMKEYRIGLAHIEALGYDINNYLNEEEIEQELFTLWISGECYE